jgi:SUMO ligase MMS21 Smc5/6 complex component
MLCKSSVNPITNPNLVYSNSYRVTVWIIFSISDISNTIVMNSFYNSKKNSTIDYISAIYYLSSSFY